MAWQMAKRGQREPHYFGCYEGGEVYHFFTDLTEILVQEIIFFGFG